MVGCQVAVKLLKIKNIDRLDYLIINLWSYRMLKRKAISKKVRDAVYRKYDGHCAYCGKKIDYNDMQVDHLIPVQRERFGKYTEEQIECFENYMPSCRRCNHAKRSYSLENFRKFLEEIPRKLKERNYIYIK